MSKPYQCSNCHETGHNKARCPGLRTEDGLPRETGSLSEKAAKYLRANGDASFREVGEAFGISFQAVQQAWARLYGVGPTPLEIDAQWRRFQVVSLALDGMLIDDIAETTGLSYAGVYSACERLGVYCLGAFDRHMEAVDRAVAAVAAGACIVDAAIDHDVSYKTLGRYLAERGVHGRPDAQRGRKDGRAGRAADLIEGGMAPSDAMRKARVSTAAVFYVRKRRERTQTR